MSDVTRRQAVKMTAAGIAVAGAAGAAAAQQEKENAGREEGTDYFRSPEKRWAGHKTADARELQKSTRPYPVRVGIEPPGDRPPAQERGFMDELKSALAPMGTPAVSEAWGPPVPQYNGARVKAPDRPEIYLIDQGYRRWIPNPATYNNLFRDWNGVWIDLEIDLIPLATQISDGAILARGTGTAPVYLIDNGVKRWIASPAIMDKYYFSWGRVYVVPPILLAFIPTGQTIAS